MGCSDQAHGKGGDRDTAENQPLREIQHLPGSAPVRTTLSFLRTDPQGAKLTGKLVLIAGVQESLQTENPSCWYGQSSPLGAAPRIKVHETAGYCCRSLRKSAASNRLRP